MVNPILCPIVKFVVRQPTGQSLSGPVVVCLDGRRESAKFRSHVHHQLFVVLRHVWMVVEATRTSWSFQLQSLFRLQQSHGVVNDSCGCAPDDSAAVLDGIPLAGQVVAH